MAMDFQLISTKTCSAEEIKFYLGIMNDEVLQSAEGTKRKTLITVVKICERDKIRQNLTKR